MISTQRLELGPNSTESFTKLKTQILKKFTYSYYDKNSKTQIRIQKKTIPYKSLKSKDKKPNFFEKWKKSSKVQKLKNI